VLAARHFVHAEATRLWDRHFDGLERQALASAARHAVPGLSLAIVQGAQLVWTRGLGLRDRSTHAPVTPDTVFEAASMSKPVFAYAVMKMRERGLILSTRR